MLRSKSRSGSSDFGQKNHSSVLSRTISASKLCRRDPLIDKDALISVERKPSKHFFHLSENPIARLSAMQQQMDDHEELRRAKEQLGAAKEERDRALDELRETKQVAREASMRLSEALPPRKVGELVAELKTVKELLSNTQRELVIKERNIETMKVELEKAKQFEVKLADKEAYLDRLKLELSNVKASKDQATSLLSESKKRIQEIEAEVERGKMSESKMFDSVVSQTKQLEETKIELEESKLEIASLHEQMKQLQISSRQSSRNLNGSHNSDHIDSTKEASGSLKSELQLAKENVARAQEGKKIALLKAKSLFDEMALLKNEMKLATDAEEKSKKAMDDLALVLKEVATEANQAKEKLSSTQVELEHVKEEAEQLKMTVRTAEDKYQKLSDEAKKETELHLNTANRLRLEAEESLLAWNGKEMGFVGCIKRAEEEKALAQHENTRVIESLKAAENMTRTAREENYKLRDILKQALNEANVAKEAASIARDENSQLKDCLAEKDEALHFLSRENERLRIDEAAALENIKELKRLLSKASTELKTEVKEGEGMFESPNPVAEEHQENKSNKAFNFNLNDLKILNERKEVDETVVDEDPEKAEALKGSIFDTAVSPRLEFHTPKSGFHHRRGSSPAFTDDGDTTNSDDFDHLDVTHFDDADSERNSHRRRKSALFRKFGDLIMRKSFHKKEPSAE